MCVAQGLFRSIGGEVDVVGSVSAGLGGGGGVAESSRVESREQASGLDARWWSQSRSRCGMSCSTFGWQKAGSSAQVLVEDAGPQRRAAGRCAQEIITRTARRLSQTT
jgi:hypothetical protein